MLDFLIEPASGGKYDAESLLVDLTTKTQRPELRGKDGISAEAEHPNMPTLTHFIAIDRSLTAPEILVTFAHELAHVLTWDQEEDDHGPIWAAERDRVIDRLETFTEKMGRKALLRRVNLERR